MKALFIPGNSPSPVFTHAPLASALRNAGHEVFMGGIEWVLPTITNVGLPAVKIAPLTTEEVAEFITAMPEDPEESARAVGEVYARIAVDSLEPLMELAGHWRPDVVVGGGMFYTAPLLAHRLGIPSVRLEWDRIVNENYDAGAADVLRPVLEELGLDRVPEPDLWIDVAPPSLRPSGAPETRSMRWVSGNAQTVIEPWMYTRPERPRVYLTAGTRLLSGEKLQEVARHVSALDVEVVVGASEEVAAPLRENLPNVRAGWIPLDVLAPTCSLIISRGNGSTDMIALSSGVPQLIVDPEYPSNAVRSVTDYGAALTLEADEAEEENIAAACRKILADPSYQERARELSAEITALPRVPELARAIEELVSKRSVA